MMNWGCFCSGLGSVEGCPTDAQRPTDGSAFVLNCLCAVGGGELPPSVAPRAMEGRQKHGNSRKGLC